MPKHIARPTDYIYAQLAAQVYEANGGTHLPSGWVMLEVCDNLDRDGYFGTAYVHQQTQQIIIAHRGTELPHSPSSTTETEISKIGHVFASLKDYVAQISNSMKDISTDINGIVRLMITSQQISALEFALAIQKQYPDYTLSFAGHSLGGWLAQICTYHFMVENHYTWCVTLDSPGARDIIEEMHARYLDSIPPSILGTFLERLDITTYVSSPNLINSCNRHLGTVYRLYVPFSAAEGWFKQTKEALRYNIESHQIVTLLENFDASTGYAKKITRVVDWPQIQWPDSKEVAKLNTTGPVQWLVTQLNDASPVKLPSALVNFVTRKLDAGVMKLINSSHMTRGFYNIGQVIRDYTTGATNKAEYNGFFEFANNRNQYAPEQDLTFRQHYQLSYQYHYAVNEFDPHYLHLRHMDKPVREFLWAYAQINQNNSFLENSKLPVTVGLDLNAYQLIQGSLIQKKGWALTLKNKPNNDTAWAWYTRVSRYLTTYPLLLQTLNQDLRSQAARLYEIAVNVDKINGKIAYIEEQHEALEKRVDALEHSAFSPLSDEDTQKLAIKAKEKLQTHYQGAAKIEGLFGKPMTLDKQYINVQMLYQTKEDKEKDKDTSKEFKDARITSFEDIFSNKQAMQISELFLPAKAILKDNQKTNELNPDQPPKFLLIQGRAGIGKTTFVNFVSHEWSFGRLWGEFDWVFTLRLRDLRDHRFTKAYEQGQTWSLSDWVYQIHFAGILNKIEFKSVWDLMIAPQLQDKVLFLLDGFDETPTEHPCQQTLTDLLNSQIHKIVTSRPYGLSELTQNKRELEVMGFVDENIEKYVQLYFGEVQANKAKQIISALRANPSLWGNAHIPVTLNILCGVLEKSHDINTSMAELETMSGLYEQMELALFAHAYCNTPQNAPTHRNQLKVLDEASRKELLIDDIYREHRGHLASLALVAFMDDKLIISPKELNRVFAEAKIPSIERYNKINDLLRLGLLKPVLGEQQVGDDPIGYEFLHLTFQEYYAGLAIVQQLMQATDENDSQLEYLHAIKFNPRYQIVFWFAAGLLNTEPQAFDRLMKVLNAPQGNDMIGHVKLGLQLCCVHEAWQAAEQTGWLSKIAEGIQNNIKVLSHAYERGVINGNTVLPGWLLLLQSLPRWLKARGPYEIFKKVDMINNEKKTVDFIGWLGVVSPQILASLGQLLKDEYNDARSSALKAIGKLGTAAATPEILKALLQLVSDKALTSSLSYKADRQRTHWLLHQPLDDMERDERDEDVKVYFRLRQTLSRLGAAAATPEFLKGLLQLLRNEDEDVRYSAISAIHALGTAAATPEFLKGLLQLLRNEDEDVRYSAISAIDTLGTAAATPEFLKGLLQLSSNENWDIRYSASKAIDTLDLAAGSSKFLQALFPLLKFENGQRVQDSAEDSIFLRDWRVFFDGNGHRLRLAATGGTPLLVALAKFLCIHTSPELVRTVTDESTLYYSEINLQTQLPEQEAKKILLALLAGGYYSGDVSGSVVWQPKQQQFAWQGFSGKKPFTLLLTHEQARWLIDAAPKIIDSLNNNTLAEKFADIEKAKPSTSLPITEAYKNLQNTSTASTSSVSEVVNNSTKPKSKQSCSLM
jgi:hypothetical protein